MTERRTRAAESRPDAKCCFVDEAGDAVLFNRRGKIIVGKPGCSRFFIVGCLDVADPDALAEDLDALRTRLVADPYFAGVPSMQSEAKKTAAAFHTKDDLPEVRRDVFEVLRRHDLRFLSVVRDKLRVVEDVKEMNRWNRRYRYSPTELYDDMVGRLFRDRLRKDDEIRICFAPRDRKPRTGAFLDALRRTWAQFPCRWETKGETPVTIQPGALAQDAGLQAVDYFLWSLQRFYERGEDRFLGLLWPQFRLVMDIDDKRETDYGAYYSQEKPLVRAALEGRRGI